MSKPGPAGGECSLKDGQECRAAVAALATLHKAMRRPELAAQSDIRAQSLLEEYEKRNRELRRVRKFLREKGQKTAFEICLQQNFDGFWEEALRVTEEVRRIKRYFARRRTRGKEPFSTGTSSIIIFCSPAGLPLSTSRSSAWAARCGISICSCASCWRRPTGLSLWREGFWTSTGGEKKLTAADFLQLYYRFAYPEKFWKIANFYYNSGKAWIPGRNMEKLEKLVDLRKAKNAFLEQTFSL